MKKMFSSFAISIGILLFSTPLVASELHPTMVELGLVKLKDGFYMGKLKRQYNGKDLFVFMRRLNGDDQAKINWTAFSIKQGEYHNRQGYSIAGSGHFQRFMTEYTKSGYNNADVWVAYVSHQPNYGQFMLKDVRLSFGVLTKNGGIVSTHTGISKLHSNAIIKNDPYTGLSMPLHAFAARVIKKEFPSVRFMVTTPAGDMLKIMAFKTTRDTFFYGSRAEKKMIADSEELYTENIQTIEDLKKTKFFNKYRDFFTTNSDDDFLLILLEEHKEIGKKSIDLKNIDDNEFKSKLDKEILMYLLLSSRNSIIDYDPKDKERNFTLYDPTTENVLFKTKLKSQDPNSFLVMNPIWPIFNEDTTKYTAITIEALAHATDKLEDQFEVPQEFLQPQ